VTDDPGEPLRVGVLFNDDENLGQADAADAAAVQAVRDCARAVAAACEENGWAAALVPASPDPIELLGRLREERVDVVFNLVEALEGDARREAAAAWLLELARLPYTGCPPRAMTLALEKPVARAVLAARGVPVPAGALLERGDEPLDALRFPVIVKPAAADASHGITLDSVVHDAAAARARARALRETYGQAAVVEEFIDGRELNVSILGEGEAAAPLPLFEIAFDERFPRDRPRIVTYAAKWGTEDDPEFSGSRSVPARGLAPAQVERVRATALAAYRALGLRDYGRVDLRLHPERGPFVVDVNPNPDISPCAGLNIAADAAGLTHAQLVGRVVRSALERRRAPTPALGR
jgi:D-alanine-D-alanine ligase